MKNFKADIGKAIETVNHAIMALMLNKMDLQECYENCANEQHSCDERKRKNKKKSKKTSVTRKKPGPKPKAV